MQPEHIQSEPPPTRSLAQLEQVVERGLETFVEVGLALAEIRDRGLFEAQGYTSFTAYLRKRWGKAPTTAFGLIAAAQAAESLEISSGAAPLNAWQARELGRIADPEERAAVWRQVNQPGAPPATGRLIREIADQRQQRLEEWPPAEPVEPHAGWSEREIALWDQLQDGQTIVVNFRTDQHLIEAARGAGLFVRIDRESDWGNPFETPADGDRATVVHNYAVHFLPFKPSFERRRDELRAKALGCWCAPARCHGDVLKAWIEERMLC